MKNTGNNNTINEYKNIVSQYQNIMTGYQDIQNINQEESSTQNWLVVFGGIFSFFVLLFILSQIIR
ncbi:hypothetical protein [Bacillus sp. 2SH]|uniref:hypothetical protein n=1 Tax=Bacillus sp. 2SH TaxID=2502202 RepID=UPI0010F6053D|nr:hypothetical protein [Bacillus sp. 2SH]